MLDDNEAPVFPEPVDVRHRRAVHDVDLPPLERPQAIERVEDRVPLDAVERRRRPAVAVEALGDNAVRRPRREPERSCAVGDVEAEPLRLGRS